MQPTSAATLDPGSPTPFSLDTFPSRHHLPLVPWPDPPLPSCPSFPRAAREPHPDPHLLRSHLSLKATHFPRSSPPSPSLSFHARTARDERSCRLPIRRPTSSSAFDPVPPEATCIAQASWLLPSAPPSSRVGLFPPCSNAMEPGRRSGQASSPADLNRGAVAGSGLPDARRTSASPCSSPESQLHRLVSSALLPPSASSRRQAQCHGTLVAGQDPPRCWPRAEPLLLTALVPVAAPTLLLIRCPPPIDDRGCMFRFAKYHHTRVFALLHFGIEDRDETAKMYPGVTEDT